MGSDSLSKKGNKGRRNRDTPTAKRKALLSLALEKWTYLTRYCPSEPVGESESRRLVDSQPHRLPLRLLAPSSSRADTKGYTATRGGAKLTEAAIDLTSRMRLGLVSPHRSMPCNPHWTMPTCSDRILANIRRPSHQYHQDDCFKGIVTVIEDKALLLPASVHPP